MMVGRARAAALLLGLAAVVFAMSTARPFALQDLPLKQTSEIGSSGPTSAASSCSKNELLVYSFCLTPAALLRLRIDDRADPVVTSAPD